MSYLNKLIYFIIIIYIYLMEKNYWEIIKPELIKIGFDIDDNFLENISLKTNKDYIKLKIFKSPMIIYNFDDSFKNTNEIIIKKCTSVGNQIKNFKTEIHLGKGSYNNIYKIKDSSSGLNYAYRMSLFKLNKIEILIESYIEIFIHGFLSIYQKIYLLNDKKNIDINWGINNILKLKYFGYDTSNNSISSVIDLMDGTLMDILLIKTIPIDKKLLILLRSLVQITCLIEHLQKEFKFVHNDLKSNNIFFKIIDRNKDDLYTPENIHFFIGDFGSSRFEINKKLINGNITFAKDTSFNSRKDLHLLINSLYFTFNNAEWIFNFFGKFNLNNQIPNNQNNLLKLYYLDESAIDKLYEPTTFKNFLAHKFKTSIDCLLTLGKSEDIISTVFSTKYRINYKN